MNDQPSKKALLRLPPKPTFTMVIVSTPVVAHPRKLRAVWTTEGQENYERFTGNFD